MDDDGDKDYKEDDKDNNEEDDKDNDCSLSSRRGLVQEDKRMVLVYTHGLFIT
jgi:hypothetical protein